ncbi:A24 family peptidase [Kerstersia gyiorum]|uniref:prepilin peptidase n=1 Tax=Kerstersia gyiorum TaxID=206506 RepID=UPI0010714C02|nr:A24 family peptidase [Kerstersia gyiorum]MCR4159365.1 A24 family peptidase [Kerstersia gyiorum]QBR40484.1 prepilin peptidase [Kerstersia gyiorum]
MTELWIGFVFVFLALVVVSDLYARKVKNIVLVVAFLIQSGFFVGWYLDKAAFATLYFFPTFVSAFAAFFVGALFFFPLWVKRIVGAGDVKFISILGFVVGLASVAQVVLMAGLFAGLHALIQALQVRKDGPDKKIERRGVPYAGYIALTAIIWLIWKLLE